MKRKVIKMLIVSLMGVLMLNSLVGCGTNNILWGEPKSDTTSDESVKSTDNDADEDEGTDKNSSKSLDSSNKDSSKGEKQSSSDSSKVNNPLSIGKTGSVSIYNTEISGYSDVSVSLAKVTRGSDADAMVNEYNSSNKAVKVTLPKNNGCECAVAEFDVTIPSNLKVSKYGITPSIELNVRGLDGESLKYDGKTHIGMNGVCISKKDAIKAGETAIIRVAFPIPKGCTDYLIIVGNDKNTQAFFKGE